MPLFNPPQLFIDACVLVAAAHSPTGGSAYALELCRRGWASALVTQLVLQEAERNIRVKLGQADLLRFYRLLSDIDFIMESPVTQQEIALYTHLIAAKDAHVLAAAVRSKADYLLTLDTKHFMTEALLQANLGPIIVTPGQFLSRYLEEHNSEEST